MREDSKVIVQACIKPYRTATVYQIIGMDNFGNKYTYLHVFPLWDMAEETARAILTGRIKTKKSEWELMGEQSWSS